MLSKVGTMTDRSLSMSKIYSDRDYNPSKFEDLWGQDPCDIRVLKGPTCLLETGTQTGLPFTPPSNTFQVSGEPVSDPEDVLITQLSLLETGSRVQADGSVCTTRLDLVTNGKY